MPGLIDTHTHIFLQGEDPSRRRLRHAAPEISGWHSGGARDGLSAARARAGIHDHPRYGDRRSGIRRRRHQAGQSSEGIHSRARACRLDARDFNDRRLCARRIRARDQVPKGVQIVDGPVEARKAAREQLDHGADWIKVYMTHRSWLDKNGESGFAANPDDRGDKAIVDEHTAGAERLHVTPTTEKACSARSTAGAIPSSTASRSATRRSRR